MMAARGTVHPAEATTEGVLSSMWHKITGFFAAPDEEGGGGEEGRPPPRRKAGGQGRRAAAPDTRRGRLHHDARRTPARQPQDEEGTGSNFKFMHHK